jgi:molybdenum cofactor cytidylyltransferase
VRRQARVALAVSDAVFVALPGQDHPRAAALEGLALTRLVLPGSAEGIGGTLREGVKALPMAGRFLLLLADLPEIGPADLAAVIAAAGSDPEALVWRGATAEGKPGHPILCDDALRPAFAGLSGDDGGRGMMGAVVDCTHLVCFPDGRARRDLDTPEDWAAWRATRR